MGIVFVENDSGRGVRVCEMGAGGAALSSGLVNTGDELVKVNDVLVVDESFDMIMAKLSSADSPATMTFSRNSVAELKPVSQPREQPARTAISRNPVEELKAASTTISVQQEDSVVSLTADKEANLRSVLLEGNVDIYTFIGKISNCNGGGQCGTCVVDVVSSDPGALSERTLTEELKLKGKSPSFRLACQCMVKGGQVSIKTKPKP
jgi:ferredoxin